jgi:hypothetical protein
VTAEYAIDDAAGVEMLTQCCQAVDLAEALSARIAEDGEIIRTMNGIKAHPASRTAWRRAASWSEHCRNWA